MDNIILGVVLIVLILVLYIILVLLIKDCADTVIFEKQRKKMFKSLENTLITYYHGDDNTSCFDEIKLIFKHIIDKNESLKRNFSSVDILLEKYIVELNANNDKFVNVHVEDTDILKKYVLQLIKEFKKNNPMEQIKGANSVLLNELIDSAKNKNMNKFDELVNQLAIEIKTTHDNLLDKEINSKKQNAVTIIGIVLSIVFGIMTFIQFFV